MLHRGCAVVRQSKSTEQMFGTGELCSVTDVGLYFSGIELISMLPSILLDILLLIFVSFLFKSHKTFV